MPGQYDECDRVNGAIKDSQLRASWVALLALLAFGCSETQTFRDAGSICVFATSVDAQEEEYEVGAPLMVRAQTPGCLQTNCYEVAVAECSMNIEGLVISVTSWFEIKLLDRIQCKSDCAFADATCSLESIDSEGLYEIRFGGTTADLEIPSIGPVLCMDTEEP